MNSIITAFLKVNFQKNCLQTKLHVRFTYYTVKKPTYKTVYKAEKNKENDVFSFHYCRSFALKVLYSLALFRKRGDEVNGVKQKNAIKYVYKTDKCYVVNCYKAGGLRKKDDEKGVIRENSEIACDSVFAKVGNVAVVFKE